MDNLDALHDQLTKANVTDEQLSRGVRLTARGTAKLARKFGVSEDELQQMLKELSKQVKGETEHTGLPASPGIFEDDDHSNLRFTYEADFQGNVNLYDTKTGASQYLQASDGAKFLQEIDRVGHDYQGLIAPYFAETLREFAEAEVIGDSGNTGGTYNFPFQGNFACARFWLEDSKPMVEVVSVVDADGEEMPLDAKAQAAAKQAAWEWVNKV